MQNFGIQASRRFFLKRPRLEQVLLFCIAFKSAFWEIKIRRKESQNWFPEIGNLNHFFFDGIQSIIAHNGNLIVP
jgi:hypothetical protein